MTSQVDEPCWESSGSVCSWVYERTEQNELAANVADFLVDRPLRFLVVLALTWLVARLARRWASRSVERIVDPDPATARRRLARLGIEPPSMLVTEVRDPRRDTRARVISSVVGGSVTVVIWVIGIITLAGIVGLQLGPLIAGAGIAGVAVGFGAQDLVKDWISGLFVLLEDHYGIGDVVDLGEVVGVVEHFSLRSTTLRSLDGTVWHVSNSEVSRSGNLSQIWSVALVDVDVAYDTDLAAAQQLLHEAAAAVCADEQFAHHVLELPVVLGVETLGADGITLRLTVKTAAGQQWALQRAIRAAVKEVFDANGVSIPFPQRTVWMRVEPGEAT
ncbi:MAG: mechanosensitive ion channel family protein [Ilumatobacteraceae bacterium]